MYQTGELYHDLLGKNTEALALPPNQLVLILGQAHKLCHWVGWVLRGTLKDSKI